MAANGKEADQHDRSISVIIPVRNGERTIERCLVSICDQTISDYEIVVVDNGSTDCTPDLINKFAAIDERIIHEFEGRPGRGHARSKGLERSTGRIIAWTDADCEVPRDWVERITAPIIIGKENIVQGNEDQILTGFWSDQAQRAGQRHMDDQVRDPPYIDHIDTKNLAISRDVLVNVSGFDGRLRALEDFELKVRLKKAGYRILYMRDLQVKHHHRETFGKLFRSRYEQGYWAGVIFFMHRDFFDSEKGRDNTIKSMYPKDLIMFPLHLVLFFLRNGPRKFLFEAVTGYIWRLGNFKGRFFHRKALEELEDG